MCSSVIVFDFETTGMDPQRGDRPIEVGAVRLDNNKIVDRFQSLMNPGFMVTSFIESLTGIGNDAIEAAPSCEEVMTSLVEFTGDTPLVAHNASFDVTFLDVELGHLGRNRENLITCSLLTSRRIFPDAPDYKLETLVQYLGIVNAGNFHRALADAEMTAYLWIAMINYLAEHFALDSVEFSLMQQIAKTPKAKVAPLVEKIAKQQKQLKQAPRLF